MRYIHNTANHVHATSCVLKCCSSQERARGLTQIWPGAAVQHEGPHSSTIPVLHPCCHCKITATLVVPPLNEALGPTFQKATLSLQRKILILGGPTKATDMSLWYPTTLTYRNPLPSSKKSYFDGILDRSSTEESPRKMILSQRTTWFTTYKPQDVQAKFRSWWNGDSHFLKSCNEL